MTPLYCLYKACWPMYLDRDEDYTLTMAYRAYEGA